MLGYLWNVSRSTGLAVYWETFSLVTPFRTFMKWLLVKTSSNFSCRWAEQQQCIFESSVGRNHDLQCTEDCTSKQHQTTADSCGYEARHECIPLTTQAVVRLDARGKNSSNVKYNATTVRLSVGQHHCEHRRISAETSDSRKYVCVRRLQQH